MFNIICDWSIDFKIGLVPTSAQKAPSLYRFCTGCKKIVFMQEKLNIGISISTVPW